MIIVEVGAGGLGLPDRDYYLKTDPRSVKIREQYAAYLRQLFTLAGESAAQAGADADATLRIETALARASLTRVDRRDPHKTYHFLSVLSSKSWHPRSTGPGFFAAEGAPGVAKLNVEQPAFMQGVQAELTTEPVEALLAYLRFHVLTAAASTLAHPFEQANFDFYARTLRGVQTMAPRWKTCTRAVDRNLGEALGRSSCGARSPQTPRPGRSGWPSRSKPRCSRRSKGWTG